MDEKKVVPIFPMNDRVVVKLMAPETVTPGGIIIPEKQRKEKRLYAGVVIAVGPGRPLPDSDGYFPMRVKRGDFVYFEQYAGNTLELYGEDIHVVPEHAILFVTVDPRNKYVVKTRDKDRGGRWVETDLRKLDDTASDVTDVVDFQPFEPITVDGCSGVMFQSMQQLCRIEYADDNETKEMPKPTQD